MNKQFLIVTVILLFLGIISRNLIFIILSIISIILVDPSIIINYIKNIKNFDYIFTSKKRNSEGITIEDGVFTMDGKVYKAVLIIDNIPFDYRDLSPESLKIKTVSFHKVLDIAKNVEIVFRKKTIDKGKLLENLYKKAQNLKIIVDSDPSNEKAKNELLMVQEMINRINEGEAPFYFYVYIILSEDNKEKAIAISHLIKKGLESLGIKSRMASKKEIEELLEDKLRFKREFVFPSQLPYLTIFSLTKSPDFELIDKGVYLGQELYTKRAIFWNINKAINPHVLIIGPTGAGKTEFLISLGFKMAYSLNIPIIFFDVKNDIKIRLRKYNLHYNLLNPLIYSLNLLNSSINNPKIYVSQLESGIRNSFRLDKYASSIMYKAILDTLSLYKKPSWDLIEDRIEQYDISMDIKFYLRRIIENIKIFDNGYDDILSKLSDGINVIDLSLIKSEELRRFIMYSVLIKLLNKYNVADDRLKVGIVIDEAWTILRVENNIDYSIVTDIVKRGRGYGISLLMATQNIQDLGESADIFLDNIGLLLFMNNGDKKFWAEIRRFVNINDEEIINELTFLKKGEALVRFINDPRPLLIKLDVLVG